MLVARFDKAGLILSQARRLGLGARFYSDVYSIESEQFLKLAGDAAEGVVYIAPRFDETANAEAKMFVARYYQKYNEPPPQMAAQVYDGVTALGLAYEKCSKADSECLKSALQVMKVEGASGVISFDETGDVRKWPTILKQVKERRFVPIS